MTFVTPSVFVTDRSASVSTVVCAAGLVLLPALGSVVPPAAEATVAVFDTTEFLGADDASLTWIVKIASAPAARPVEFVHVTTWPAAEHAGDEPAAWNVRLAGRVSVKLNPPVLFDGPPLWTVIV